MGQRLQQAARRFGLGQLRGQLVDAAHVAGFNCADDHVAVVEWVHAITRR